MVAGSVVRRWNGKGGGRRRGPCVLFSGAVSSGQLAGPVASGAETDLSDAQLSVPSGSETDFSDLERCVPAAETDFGGAGRLPTCSLLLLRVLLEMLEMLSVCAVLVVLFIQFAVLESSWLEQVVDQLV